MRLILQWSIEAYQPDFGAKREHLLVVDDILFGHGGFALCVSVLISKISINFHKKSRYGVFCLGYDWFEFSYLALHFVLLGF